MSRGDDEYWGRGSSTRVEKKGRFVDDDEWDDLGTGPSVPAAEARENDDWDDWGTGPSVPAAEEIEIDDW